MIDKEKLIKKAIEEKNYAGMWCMNLLPKSCKRLQNKYNIADKQELRSLTVSMDDEDYICFLLSLADTQDQLWAIWSLKPKPSKFHSYIHYAKETWRGSFLQEVNEIQETMC